MKKLNKPMFVCLFTVLNILQLSSQNGADILIDHGPCDPIIILLCPSGVNNAGDAVDNSLNTFATMKTTLGLLSSSFLEIGFSNPAPAKSIVGVYIGADITLNIDALATVGLFLYDEDGDLITAKTGLALADVQILTDGRGLVKIKVPGNASAHALKITLGGLVSLNNQLLVYGAVHAPSSVSIMADYVYAHGPCDPIVLLACPSGVVNPNNSVDAIKNNYALLAIPLGIFDAAFLDLGFSDPGAPGSTVAFVCGTNGTPLGVSLLAGLKLTVYNELGQVIKTKNGFTLAEIELIGSDRFRIKVKTPGGAGNIARARLTLSNVLGLLTEVRVYSAYYAPIIDFESYFKYAGEDMTSGEELLLYPNPASNFLYVTTGESSDEISLSVFSVDGKLMTTQTGTNTDIEKLDVSALQDGMYILSVRSNGELINNSFVIER